MYDTDSLSFGVLVEYSLFREEEQAWMLVAGDRCAGYLPALRGYLQAKAARLCIGPAAGSVPRITSAPE